MTPYQLERQKRRTLISFLAAFLFHFLILGGFILYGYLFVDDLSEYSGPVLVKLGEPEGEDIPVLPEEDPEEETVPVESSPVSETPDTPPDSPEETASVSEPAAVSETAELPVPVESSDAVTAEDSAESASEESPVEQPQPEAPAIPQAVIFGDKAGNSLEFQYDSGGRVGRSLGAEIYLYMPLPKFISMDLFNRIQGDSYYSGTSRQDLILKYYKNLNQELALFIEPLPDEVRAIWDYLIDAGYDYQNADYKSDGYLRPVVISFSISPEGTLMNVDVQKSSGNSDVDQAVLEGFRNAAFSNSEDREINGRFTYRFQ